jgi:uncharacterized protein
LSLYLDTSLLVSLITAESDGPRIALWLQSQASEDLLVSDWVVTEFSAALSIKLRSGAIDAAQRGTALAEFSRICAESAAVLPVTRSQFRTAAGLADQHATGLRGGDALHLAIALDKRATLCTLDRRLNDAGFALGVATLLV